MLDISIAHAWLYMAETIVIYITIIAMFLKIAQSLVDTYPQFAMIYKKKYIIFPSILVGEYWSIILLSPILGVSTVNTWLGGVGVAVIFLTLIIMAINIAISLKNVHLKLIIYFFAFFFTVIGIITTVVIFAITKTM